MADRLMKTVFDWEYFALYLSGPMDFAPDGGKGWRDVWTEKFVQMGINSKQIYNPCKKPFNDAQFGLDDEAALAAECRRNEDWDGLEEIMGQIMHVDCRLVDKADIIVVNFPRLPSLPGVELLLAPGYEESPQALRTLYEKHRSSRVPTYGTIHEIVLAHQQRKPVFIVWEETGKKDCSAWIMRLVGHRNVFAHVDELIAHLSAISQGEKSFNANEWLLLDPK